MLDNFSYLLQTIITCSFLWASLYILSRNLRTQSSSKEWWQRPSTTAGISIGLTSFFYFGATIHLNILSIDDYLFWGKLTWWSDPIGMTFWFITIYNITFERQLKTKKTLLFKKLIFTIAFIYAILIAILGTFTDLIFNYAQIESLAANNGIAHLYVPPANLSFLYSFQAPILSWICSALLLHRLAIANREYPNYLIYRNTFLGAGLLAIGSSIAAIGYFGVKWHSAELVSTIFFFISLIFFVRGIFFYNLLMGSRTLKFDIVRSVIEVVIISMIYLIGLILIQYTTWADSFAHPGFFTGILYLTTLLHTPFRINQTIIDGILPTSLLPAWEKRYIEQISHIKQEIITAVDSKTAITTADNNNIKDATRNAQKGELSMMIENQINKIFRHKSIEDNELLSRSRLLELKILQKEIGIFRKENEMPDKDLTTSQLALVLRLFLNKQIKAISPDGQEPPSQKPSPEWIEYNILNQRYILGKHQNKVEEFLEQMGVVATGGAYARHLQNGRKRLATQILQRELLCRQENAKPG